MTDCTVSIVSRSCANLLSLSHIVLIVFLFSYVLLHHIFSCCLEWAGRGGGFVQFSKLEKEINTLFLEVVPWLFEQGDRFKTYLSVVTFHNRSQTCLFPVYSRRLISLHPDL